MSQLKFYVYSFLLLAVLWLLLKPPLITIPIGMMLYAVHLLVIIHGRRKERIKELMKKKGN